MYIMSTDSHSHAMRWAYCCAYVRDEENENEAGEVAPLPVIVHSVEIHAC